MLTETLQAARNEIFQLAASLQAKGLHSAAEYARGNWKHYAASPADLEELRTMERTA